jgi:[protein-PII] uridylyltransferase
LDIRGTNPEAWSDWKGNLLADLMEHILSPQASAYLKLIEKLEAKNLVGDKEFLSALDPRLLECLPARLLAQDSRQLKGRKSPADPLIVKEKSNHYWVRFHHPKDESGLFLRFVKVLHQTGASIQEAYIQSFDSYGVYDWFRIRSSKTKVQLKKLLERSDPELVTASVPRIEFTEIEAVQVDDTEAILSFRGRDQRGALLCAAEALHRGGMPIIWAKLNTWGRQIDDVFAVRADAERVMRFLHKEASEIQG